MKRLKLEGVRIKAVLIVFIIVLSLMLLGQYLLRKKLVIQPIYEAFAGIESVSSVALVENGEQLTLTLTLQEVGRLDDAINEIFQTADQFSMPFQIQIKDQADDKLESVYHQMHYMIEQSITQGNFVEMAETIEEVAESNQIYHRLKIDRSYVYLQLHHGNNYLYQVISRHDQPRIVRLDS